MKRRPQLSIAIPKDPVLPINEQLIIDNKYTAKLSDIDYHGQMGLYASSTEFNKNLIEKLKTLFPNSENIEIENFIADAYSLNSRSHKIIIIDDKKYHFKPAIQTANSNHGSKYNEFLYYKMCEYLGIGPRCEGITMEDSGALFILTEDLSTRNIKGKKKDISFATRKSDAEFEQIPERQQDNIHRIVLNLAIFLLDLDDLQTNSANLGTKTSNQKKKVFLFDFLLNELPVFLNGDLDEFFNFISQIIEGKDIESIPDKDKHLEKFFIPCKLDKDSVKAAIEKLCIDKTATPDSISKKLQNNFTKALEYVKNMLSTIHYEMPRNEDLNKDKEIHIKAIDELAKKQRQLIKKFLENPGIAKFLHEIVLKITSSSKRSSSDEELRPTTDAPPAKIRRVDGLSIKSGEEVLSSPSTTSPSGASPSPLVKSVEAKIDSPSSSKSFSPS
jgi:hypothetical protein